ncbi:MAG: beta-glucosidase BglX [Phaeodactylibacter sp.]|nr:beta-glucosidase BglX [Phaeodactylibacter sp.]
MKTGSNTMRSLQFLILFLCFVINACAQKLVSPNYESKIDALIGLMTLEEKIGQLTQISNHFDLTGPPPQEGDDKKRYELLSKGLIGSMLNVTSVEDTRRAQEMVLEKSRLGIPLLFGMDVIHGYRTMFPIPLGEAASWDLEAVELSSRIAAREASASGIHWTFAPVVDITRDARWGRIMEGAGEDPYLGSLVAAARVRGFQGDHLDSSYTIAACAKHFAAYGFAESGRDYNIVDMSENTLYNVVLPPFKACLDAGVATFMSGYHELNGIPATADPLLLRDILKGEWGFEGFVVSDYNSVREVASHGLASNRQEATQRAILAGSDMDMGSLCYSTYLGELVESGRVPESVADEAVRRVLRVKFQLGLFEDPFRYCSPERERTEVYSEKNRAASLDIARKSIVLLKNEGGLLPLKQPRRIAVIGPLVKDKDVPLGSWRARAIDNSAVSLWEGLQKTLHKDTELLYAEGCRITAGKRSFRDKLTISYDTSGFAAAREAARDADLVIMAIGEDCFQSAEARSRTDIGLPGVQQQLLETVYAVNPNVVVVLMNGRPLDLSWMAENVPAIVETWFLGSESGNAIADVLSGKYNPSGKLPASFPRSVGQLPIYYNHKSTGRPGNENHNHIFWSHYIDEKQGPLWPFGYGLSYTTFEYTGLELNKTVISSDEQLEVKATLENTGKMGGHEIAQLYICDLAGSITRPVKELKGFRKIWLEAGEQREITFTLTAEDLKFYNAAGKWEAEPGEFKVFVGGNSRENLEAVFELKETR